MTIIISVLTWYILGASSFIYYWTKKFDLTVWDLLPSLFIGTLGPLVFMAIVVEIVLDKYGGMVLIKKRKGENE